MQWVKDNNIGGGFTWDTSLDDFNGKFCNEGKFPLINTAITTLNGVSLSTSATTLASSTLAPTIAISGTTQSLTSSATSTGENDFIL